MTSIRNSVITSNITMKKFSDYSAFIEKVIRDLSFPGDALAGLYQPISYSLSAGGKRIRPSLALMAADAFGSAADAAVDAAVALEVFHNFVDHLGSAVASMINLLDCERVAIGGGVSAAGEFLFEPLRKNVHAKSFFENHGSVVPAVMGNDAGIIGAAMLRRNEE